MTKEEKYIALLPQAKALCEGESDTIAKMANISALLHHEFGFWWTGFYRVLASPQEVGELVLGPFQGPLACVHIGVPRPHSLQQREPQRDSGARVQGRGGRSRARHRQPRTRHLRRHRPPLSGTGRRTHRLTETQHAASLHRGTTDTETHHATSLQFPNPSHRLPKKRMV